MKEMSWTVLALLALSWNCVQSRSIDTPAKTQQDATVDAIAEGLTAEIVKAAFESAINTQAQKASSPQEQIAETIILRAVEGEAVREVSEVAKEIETGSSNNNNDAPAAILDFETGTGDNDNELSGTRDKRTVGQIGRLATCLFTILVNPNCFQQMRSSGGGGGGGLFGGLLGGGGSQASSRSSARQEAYNRQLRQWMQYQKTQIARLNATEGGNYTTPFPILPPSPPAEEDEPTTARPNFIGQVIQFKLNLIPNLFRTARSLVQSFLPFLQNLGGGGGGGSGGGLLGGLGGLFGGNRGGSSSSSGSYGGSSGSSSYGSGSYRPSSISSGSSNYDSSGSGSSGSSLSSSSSGGTETSTYRIQLGRK